MTKLTDKIRAEADEVREMTVAEAAKLPNMLGALASGMLKAQGWYSYTQGGRKHLIVAKA
jgi:hypothetical protein